MNAGRRYFPVVIAVLLAALGFSQSAEDKKASLTDHIRKARAYLSQKHPDLAIPELEAALARATELRRQEVEPHVRHYLRSVLRIITDTPFQISHRGVGIAQDVSKLGAHSLRHR